MDGNKKSFDINILNGGFFNLYTFILQAIQKDFDDKDSFITPDFDKPINMKFMMNDKAAYIKSDLIIGAMLRGYPYNYLDKEYKETAKNKWYKRNIDTENNVVTNYDEMDINKKIETVLKGFSTGFDGHYGYRSTGSIYYYNTLKNAIKELWGDDKLTLTANADGTYQASLSIDDKAIFEIITDAVSSICADNKDEVLKNIKEYSDVCHFKFNLTSSIKDGVVLNSLAEAEFKMDNIPNPFKIQIGTIEAKYSITSAASDIGKVKITDDEFPSGNNLLDEEQLKNDSEQAKTKYYKDLGFSVDENGNVDFSKKNNEEMADV